MCGLTGLYSFNNDGEKYRSSMEKAMALLRHRGPDAHGISTLKKVILGHVRLSIIDLTVKANQPMSDASGRYLLAFNGEIFNFKELRRSLEYKGYSFYTSADTEVLLKMLIEYDSEALTQLNGFFSFAFYDSLKDELLISRDRMGVKPMYYTTGNDCVIFGSELRSLLCFPINKKLNYSAVTTYLQCNYIPGNQSIVQGIYKLSPGSFIRLKNNSLSISKYYTIPYEPTAYTQDSFEQSKGKLIDIIEESVHKRLVSDVPLGAFLSGGLDSSIISAIAAKQMGNLQTFSIGYKDHPFFDETNYAKSVAKHIGSNHTVFNLSNAELYDNLHSYLSDVDEPMADSSAIAVHLLCKYTRRNITVALSGDGADELFGGYNKHLAECNARQNFIKNTLAISSVPFMDIFPQSRNSKTGNLARKIKKYATGLKLSKAERYRLWASFIDRDNALNLLNPTVRSLAAEDLLSPYIHGISERGDLNEILLADCNLVLPYDMLTKIDTMSMANSLEVRTPFLDVNVVNFAFSLPDSYKITTKCRKKILQETFKSFLPDALYNRPKQGFEVPILDWMNNEFKNDILSNYLNEGKIRDEKLFNPIAVNRLRQKLFSKNPGDAHATTWAIIVLEAWIHKNL